MWLYVVLTSVLALLWYFGGIRPFKYWEKLKVRHVKPKPFVGNILPLILRRKAFADLTDDIYQAFPDEKVIGFYQTVMPVLLIKDPELIKVITVKEFSTFPQHATIIPEDVDPLWAKNLFAMKGTERWHLMRSTLSPFFTSSKMKMMFGLMKECAANFVSYFTQKEEELITVELKNVFTRYTNDVIATAAFGISCNSLDSPQNEFYIMAKDASTFTGLRWIKFFTARFLPSIMKMLGVGVIATAPSKFFRKIIIGNLKTRHEKGIVRPDMIHLVMEARKGKFKEDAKEIETGFATAHEYEAVEKVQGKAELTDEDITAQAMVFLIAGFETASSFMSFTAYELAINPEVQEKLRREVDEVFERCQGDINYDTLLKMKYLDMVVSESLRKWPPNFATDRENVRPFTVTFADPARQPVTFPPGKYFWIPIFSIHRDPKNYPNPLKFDPERFSDENKENIKPYTYLPFGAGPRNCIGSRFVLLEGKLIIVEILRRFEIVPIAKTQIPLELEKGGMIPVPKDGFWLGFKPRVR